MCGRNVVGIHRCDTQSISKIRINASSASAVTKYFKRPMVSAARVHGRSLSAPSTAPLGSALVFLRRGRPCGSWLFCCLTGLGRNTSFRSLAVPMSHKS